MKLCQKKGVKSLACVLLMTLWLSHGAVPLRLIPELSNPEGWSALPLYRSMLQHCGAAPF